MLQPSASETQKATSKSTKEKKPFSLKNELLSWLLPLIFALVLVTLMRMFLFELVPVKGSSMTNTLQDGEIMFCSRLAYRLEDVERNDIVICRYPGRTENTLHLSSNLTLQQYSMFVKRIVALPGDTVVIENGQLIVNGEIVPDPEFMGSVPRDFATILLGPDQYFAIGDNRLTSHDSRAADVGPISRDMIMSKVRCVIWPLGNIRSVH